MAESKPSDQRRDPAHLIMDEAEEVIRRAAHRLQIEATPLLGPILAQDYEG